MSTLTFEPLAFRCTKCWQIACTTTEKTGQLVACQSCGEELQVPEATLQRIEQGRQYLAEFEESTLLETTEHVESEQVTDREIFQLARQSAREKASPEQLVCSRTRRLLASIIDSVALMFAGFIGTIIAYVISPPVPDQLNPGFLIIFLAPALMLAVVQWCMTALDGRTLGKYCLNTKVVNLQGEAPGWLQGVILRSWLIGLLAMIPFFGLLDAAWIFSNESNRCIHDLIAGTYVIEAS